MSQGLAIKSDSSLQSFRQLIASLNGPKVKRYILYGIIICSTCVSLFFLAALAYIVVYIIYIPSASIHTHVDLDFSFVKPGAFAIANISQIPFSSGVDYNVYLELDLPRTTRNQELGNFMLRTTVVDNLVPFSARAHISTGSSRWPFTHDKKHVFDGLGPELTKTKMAIMPYKSQLLEFFDTILFLPLYLLNLKSQHSVLRIPFYELSKPVPALKYAVIELDRIVDINSAQLIWTVRWRGVRYLMYNYKIFMFVVGTWSFWIVETVVMAAVAYYVVHQFGGTNEFTVTIAFDSTPDNSSSNYGTPLENNISAFNFIAERELSARPQPSSSEDNGLISTSSRDKDAESTDMGEIGDEQITPQETVESRRGLLTPEPTPGPE
jgi:hypothetical protein